MSYYNVQAGLHYYQDDTTSKAYGDCNPAGANKTTMAGIIGVASYEGAQYYDQLAPNSFAPYYTQQPNQESNEPLYPFCNTVDGVPCDSTTLSKYTTIGPFVPSATEVIDIGNGAKPLIGTGSCHYYDYMGYILNSTPTSMSCSCDGGQYSWSPWPTYLLADAYQGGIIGQQSPATRTLESVQEQNGRYRLLQDMGDGSGRKSLVVKNSPIPYTAGSSGQLVATGLSPDATWKSYSYVSPTVPSLGSGLVASQYSPSIQDSAGGTNGIP